MVVVLVVGPGHSHSHNMEAELPILVAALGGYANIPGMHVNVLKTVGIPLWQATEAEVQHDVATCAPEWSELPIRSHATYLGHDIGPGKCGNEWK